MAHGNFLRISRQLTLLVLLVMIAAGGYLTRARTTSWHEPLWVSVYPIATQESKPIAEYIGRLNEKTFAPIERFMVREAERYGVTMTRPVRVDLAEPIKILPPPPPESANPLRIALWSLQLRWWAYRTTKDQPGPPPDIRLFAVYHDPDHSGALPHSLGLQKGLLGVAHVFADRRYAGSNNVIITHEMLHTLGAADKYAAGTNLPAYPEGYAEPELKPLYPQSKAEIMAGRIPVSETKAEMPGSLKKVLVGPATAAEIRWAEAYY